MNTIVKLETYIRAFDRLTTVFVPLERAWSRAVGGHKPQQCRVRAHAEAERRAA